MLESANRTVFKSPLMEWITDRVSHVKEVLEEKTSQTALLLLKLMGEIRLKPVIPDIGKPYLMATGGVYTSGCVTTSNIIIITVL